jgi:hypothetical protein
MAEWIRAELPTPGLPGDFNGDGAVDAADYVVWRHGLGSPYTQADYDIWKAHFGETTGSGASATGSANVNTAVPEPCAIVLAAIALASILAAHESRRVVPRLCG